MAHRLQIKGAAKAGSVGPRSAKGEVCGSNGTEAGRVNNAGVVAAERTKGAGVVTAVSGPLTVSREEALPLLLKFRDDLERIALAGTGSRGLSP